MLEETRPDGYGRARGLVSSRVSGERITARTFAPNPMLGDVVDYFWVTRWDLRNQPPHTAEILTDPCVNIVFEATRSRVVGVSTRLFRRELVDEGLIRAVKLRAGAARALLTADSVTSYRDRMLPLAAVFDDTEDLESTILAPADDQEAFARLGAWLLPRLAHPRDPKIVLAARAVEQITRDPDVTRARDVADASGLALRDLQRLFHDYVGASPKWVIRRYRLQEAALRLERGDRTSLAMLAAQLGYSDHAHLSRDFKMATGRSPSEFARSVWE
jgi:AraC-like DNA-binding protein